jgi:hypothetical protein
MVRVTVVVKDCACMPGPIVVVEGEDAHPDNDKTNAGMNN